MTAINYKNAYTEVYEILSYLDEEEYAKIPQDTIKAIRDNMNKDYKYEMKENMNLESQPMLPETKAILFNLFRDYLSTPEQKEKILKMQAEDRKKAELKKQEQYGNKEIFSKKQEENVVDTHPTTIRKENIFTKLINQIKKIFSKTKINY